MSAQRPGVGMTGFAILPPAPTAELDPDELDLLRQAAGILGGKRFAVLTEPASALIPVSLTTGARGLRRGIR